MKGNISPGYHYLPGEDSLVTEIQTLLCSKKYLNSTSPERKKSNEEEPEEENLPK